MNLTEEIIGNIYAGVPGIHIVSDEYLRLDALVSEIAIELKFTIKEWNLGFGQINSADGHRMLKEGRNRTLAEFLDDVSGSMLDGKLLYIKNAKLALERNKEYIAHLQQILIKIQEYFKGRSCVIYTSEERYIPLELSPLVYYTEHAPPDNKELTEIIQTYITEHKNKISSELKRKFISICTGLDKETVFQILSKIFVSKAVFEEKDLEIARNAKEQKVSKSGYIEMVPLKESFDDLGGLEELKQYLHRKKLIIDDLVSATRLGILPPKGILLAGLPGCGKSLAAKSAAYLFNLPLLRIDIGSLMGKYVGESENNLKNALRVVEHANPCVLWLDEIEKGFSGMRGDSGGSGVATRMFGYFLMWMQERQGTVFVIATANNIIKVPPELWRKGRFDECFFVNFPNKSEREQILKIYLDKISYKESDISIQAIAEYTAGYSGADIQALINDALETAFIEKRKLNSSIIKERRKKITSLKIMLGKKRIEKYEELRTKFGIKPASWTLDEIKAFEDNLEKDAASPDPTIREKAAKNTQCPPEILERLAEDKDKTVQRAVFQNPGCPQGILESYLNKNKPLKNTATNPDNEKILNFMNRNDLYNLALSHRNTSGRIIAVLYKKQKIDRKILFNVISSRKSMDNELASLFNPIKVTLPEDMNSALVKRYHVSENSLYSKGEAIADLDDENGSNFTLTCPFDAIVKEITVPTNERIDGDKALLWLYVLKDEIPRQNGG